MYFLNTKTIKTLLTILLLSANLQASILNDHIMDMASSNEDAYVKQQGGLLTLAMLGVFKELKKTSNIKVTDFTPGEITTLKVSWTINKNRFSQTMNGRLPLYEGESAELTKVDYGRSVSRLSMLYFFERPLGQPNGTTYKFPDNKLGEFYKKIITNYKAFVVVKHREFEQYIPIITTAKDSCGGDIFTKMPNILCVQTSQSADFDLNIGHEIGFGNTISIPYFIENEDEITLKFTEFYEGIEI